MDLDQHEEHGNTTRQEIDDRQARILAVAGVGYPNCIAGQTSLLRSLLLSRMALGASRLTPDASPSLHAVHCTTHFPEPELTVGVRRLPAGGVGVQWIIPAEGVWEC